MYHNLEATNIVWKLLLTDLMAKYDIENKINYEHEHINRNLAVLPNPDLVFAAFNHFSLDELKVVIIGQDPYINNEQAMGLSFSVPEGVKLPPSLKNVYKCIENTCDTSMDFKKGDLTKWAEQGVLLLNTTLTVFEKISNSHKKIWKGFSLDLLKYISDNTSGVVFLLWGNDARKLKSTIDIDKHHILEHTHPSPLSRKSFVDCDHFIRTNEILHEKGKTEIDWQIA
jgi:uracil-DNA glycosylase